MKKQNFGFIGIGIAIAAASVLAISFSAEEKPKDVRLLNLDFTYSEANSNLKNALIEKSISMSSPIELKSPNNIKEFCTFFNEPEKQNVVQYCTSTELKDSQGLFLGNIHLVGSSIAPKIVMIVIQDDPFLNQIEYTKTIFEIVVETLVCDCWKEENPGGFPTVGDWVEEINKRHVETKKPTSKSEITGLEGKKLTVEVTTNSEGYLWKFLIHN